MAMTGRPVIWISVVCPMQPWRALNATMTV